MLSIRIKQDLICFLWRDVISMIEYQSFKDLNCFYVIQGVKTDFENKCAVLHFQCALASSIRIPLYGISEHDTHFLSITRLIP